MRSWYKSTALLVQVLEPAAFLGKPLYIRYYWSFKFVNKNSMKKKIQKIQRSSIESYWFMIPQTISNDTTPLHFESFWLLQKKVYQEAAPFPGGLSQQTSFRRECFDVAWSLLHAVLWALVHDYQLSLWHTVNRDPSQGDHHRIEPACDGCFQSQFRRWHSLWSSQIWEFAIVDCDFKHCSKVKEPLDRFGMISFYCCDMLWSFVTLQSVRVRDG